MADVCKCGFYNRLREHPAVGGGTCEYYRIPELESQLAAANARVEALECRWREVDEKPPSNQPILIEMKMPNGETRYDMTMSDLLDNALYVTRWAPAPPEQEGSSDE